MFSIDRDLIAGIQLFQGMMEIITTTNFNQKLNSLSAQLQEDYSGLIMFHAIPSNVPVNATKNKGGLS